MADSGLATRITAIVRRTGRVHPATRITEESRLVEDLGIDSLDLVSVYLTVQERYGLEFDDAELESMPRVGDLVARVAARRAAARVHRPASAA